MNKTISYFKSHPFIVVLFVIIAVLLVVEITTKALSDFSGSSLSISGETNPPILMQFSLNQYKSTYVEKKIAIFGKGAKVKTYIANIKVPDANTHSSAASYPVFDVVINNPAKEQLVITKIMVNIDDIGQVRGIGPGPVESTHQYTHKLEYKKGVQEYELVSPITIPAKSSGAFELAMFTEYPELGLSWWTNVEFQTNKGNVSTDMFQIILSGRPAWALKILEPIRERRPPLKDLQQLQQQETAKIPLPPAGPEGSTMKQEELRQHPRTPAFLGDK